jgi:hypothetical protein
LRQIIERGFFQLGYSGVAPAADTALRDLGEEALDQIHSTAAGRREMEIIASMTGTTASI